MAEYERTSQKNQEKADQKHRVRQQYSQPVFDHFHAWEQGALSIGETPFQPRMDEHAALLSRIPFAKQRHDFILQLQQTYGNRYVQRLVESGVAQSKLSVNPPNDVYEQEADRVARAVTRADNSQVQRQEEEEELQMQEEEEEESVQTKAALETQRQDLPEEEIQAQLTQNEPLSVSDDLETRIHSARGGGHMSPAAPLVQRLMSYNAFKKSTKVFGTIRSKSRIKNLDNALKSYDATANIESRLNAYRKIYRECYLYMGIADTAKPKPKRKKGVKALSDQVENEGVALMGTTLKEAEDAGIDDLDNKYKKAKDADWVIEFCKNNLHKDVAAQVARLRQVYLVFIKKDVETLRKIAEDATAPEITKSVVKEIMANLGKIRFEMGRPGATRVFGEEKSWKVEHSLEQKGGEAERVGSLAHEMTHVAVGESFENTMLVFSFAKDAPDDEVKELIQKRHENIKQLNTALTQSNLDAAQTKLVSQKLTYAAGFKTIKYIDDFKQAKKISDEEAEALYEKTKKLGLDNTVIEYDSVINQILVCMYMWKIPPANPLHKKTIELAKEAQEQRQYMKLLTQIKAISRLLHPVK